MCKGGQFVPASDAKRYHHKNHQGAKRVKRIMLSAFAGAAVICTAVSTAQANEILSASQIKSFVPGRAKAQISGDTVTISLSRRGTLSGKWAGERDHGSWHVSGDRLCIKFNNWLGGATRCSAVARSGNAYRVSGVTFVKY